MAEMTMNALKFAKLNGSNYRTWSFNMRLFLESQDLFGHADGTAEAPATDASAELRRSFNLGAKKAWTHICLAIEAEYQIHVRDTTTAKEAWDALKGQFARESLLQKVRLRQQYYSCRFRSGGNMLEHIGHLRSLHNQLKEMGVNIDDKELAMTLLASLPEEFKPLITALDAVGDENVSYDKVKNMLLNDFDRNSDAKGSEKAFSAKRWYKKGNQHSGDPGSGKNNPGSGNVFRGKCHNCQEKGHFARDCPKRNTKGNFNGPNRRDNTGSARCAEQEDCDVIDNDEALFTSDLLNNSGWIIDSGATQHMTCEKSRLSDYVEFKQPCTVNLGDNRTILAYGKGTYRIVADLGDQVQHISLRDVLYLPDLEKNLLSVRAMVRLGATVQFEGDKCEIVRNSKLLAVGKMLGKLYILKTVPDEHVNIAREDSDAELWHCRFGHLGMNNLTKLIKDKMIEGMDGVSVSNGERKLVCEACIMGKQHQTKYPKGDAKRASEPFELVHSDVCGPVSVNSIGGSRYFVTFIDDYTRYTHVYFIKHKDEVLEKCKEFVNYATNLTGKQVKTLRTDNGGEYCSKEFDLYLKEKGIVHQTTVPYNPAQNGVSERMNRTLVESARSMMSHANMPIKFWAEAVNTAVYLRNRSPTTSVKGVTPYECLFDQKPNVSNLKVFGCEAFAHIPDEQRKKFDEKSRKAIFVGYPAGTKGYKLYDQSTRKFIRSRDVVFVERKFHNFDGVSVKSSTDTDFYIEVEVQDVPVEGDHPDDELDDEEAEAVHNRPVGATFEENFLRQVQNVGPTRQRKEPERFRPDECNYTESLTAENDEPQSVKEAVNGKNSSKWKTALEDEYNSLVNNETWELVPPPKKFKYHITLFGKE